MKGHAARLFAMWVVAFLLLVAWDVLAHTRNPGVFVSAGAGLVSIAVVYGTEAVTVAIRNRRSERNPRSWYEP